MEITLEKCAAINDAASTQGVKLAIGHVLRFDSEYVAIKYQIEKNAIGEPKMVRCTRHGPPPGWASWFFDESKSGAVILDLSINDIDLICCLALESPADRRGAVPAIFLPVLYPGYF
jgi:myo-inositol 2-dehydrogenase/D-chiro-inositol 1-dehydrogenase